MNTKQLFDELTAADLINLQKEWPDHEVKVEWQIDDCLRNDGASNAAPTMILYSEEDVRKYLHQFVDRMNVGGRTVRLEMMIRRCVRVMPKVASDADAFKQAT